MPPARRPSAGDCACGADSYPAVAATGDRELLRLVYWESLTLDQAATVIGITHPAARKRAQRAREQLRGRATRSGSTSAGRGRPARPARPRTRAGAGC
ncbi:sigma factor-like helix-turn-helix DNA-binding protein [Arsenicicoccus piscis]|uniref:sigma factor-like helix-turn-helix DNA-binding protein n=1 Tax=Arsenicicoccus piscis TaxID=673954 RepID=UPI003B98247E